jgi:hypothetical protein
MEGLEIIKIYLNTFGYISIDNDTTFDKQKLDSKQDIKTDGFRFCEFHGGIEKDLRTHNKNIFNMKDNRYGKYCKIILVSPAGAEGINLNNVRQVHIVEPYWNETRIEQVIGRAVRFCQHKDLPMDERKVDIFRYKMIRKNGKSTSDEFIENHSKQKHNLLSSFIDTVKEAAVDCKLFSAHNMMNGNYNCFQFNQESLFEPNIGPAYNIKLEYDTRYDNGSNSLFSELRRIKVRSISVVKKLSDSTFSDIIKCWVDDDTGIVYDHELDFPLGKLLRDENGSYVYYNDNYVLEQVINIPSSYQ